MDKFNEAIVNPTFNFSLLLNMLACSLILLTQTVTAASSEAVVHSTITNASPCSLPLNRLNQTITKDLFPSGYEVFINCLSFDEHGALRRGIVSGHDSRSENQTMRFMIECASKDSRILVALQSEMEANITSDIRELEYSACVECEDSIDHCRMRKYIVFAESIDRSGIDINCIAATVFTYRCSPRTLNACNQIMVIVQRIIMVSTLTGAQ